MKKSLVFIRLLLLVIDFLLLELVFFLTYLTRFKSGIFQNPIEFTWGEFLWPSLIVAVYWILLLSWFGLYRLDPLQSRAEVSRDSSKAVLFGILLLFILTFNPADPLPSTRVVLAVYGLSIFSIALVSRLGILTVLREFRVRGFGGWRTLLVGSGQRLSEIHRHLQRHPELGARITGVITGEKAAADLPPGIPYLGTLSSLRAVIQRERIESLIFALSEREEPHLGRMVRLASAEPIRTFIQADQYQLLIGAVRPLHVPGHPLIEIRSEVLTVIERFWKRTTDILIAALMFLLTLPLSLLLMALIPLESRGPAIFAQRRVGRFGREFTMLKFRSMRLDAEAETGAVFAAANDPRITRIGRIIRATRMDELPQLINVLAGSMSIVGPRPERREFVDQFSRTVPLYERRLNVKPGLTGWAQVNLKYDSRGDQVALKLKYDIYYIENISLPLDFKILMMTLFVVMRGEGL